MKKLRPMTNRRITGYTNDTAAAFRRGNEINSNHLCFCPESRYKKCCKRKICDRLEPGCVYDEFQLIGKKHRPFARNAITKTDEAKVKRILAAAVKRCRPVVVTIAVGKAG